ncbi:MAG TPA: FxLYD domain-containing protein [Candidatus Eremiobacteraceae bacterium]|nr:FxLYD domain-containing protein [Candidatus Eremiobacteraceae bacterium]
MSTSFPIPPSQDDQSTGTRRRFVILAVSLVFLLLAFFLWRASTKRDQPAATGSQDALGPDGRAYTSKVGVDHIEISRAENFLHQEVTTISGEISNGGNRALASVELTIEFYDDLNQIAQRETRSLFGPPGPPIPPGDHREFEVSFEHISSSWNMRQPVIKVTAVQFAASK